MAKTKTIRGFEGLKYVTILDVPIRKSKHGDIIDISASELERKVAIAIIENRVPIRGAELKVVKSALGLSLDKIGEKLGVSKNTVMAWSKATQKRLSCPYEMAIRVLAGELLGVELQASIDDLKADDKAKKIEIIVA